MNFLKPNLLKKNFKKKFLLFLCFLLLILYVVNDFYYLRYTLLYKTERLVPEILEINNAFQLKSYCDCKKDIIEISRKSDTYLIKATNGQSYSFNKKSINPGATTCNLYNTLRRGTNQKIIGYSLYGTDPKYYINLKKIARQAKTLYPDWIIRIHHDNSINSSIICEIECLKNDENEEYLDNVDFCDMNRIPYGSQVETWNANYINKMIWRWLPIGDPFVDIFISRDKDSPLSQRELVNS
jgi:hypothetical protein